MVLLASSMLLTTANRTPAAFRIVVPAASLVKISESPSMNCIHGLDIPAAPKGEPTTTLSAPLLTTFARIPLPVPMYWRSRSFISRSCASGLAHVAALGAGTDAATEPGLRRLLDVAATGRHIGLHVHVGLDEAEKLRVVHDRVVQGTRKVHLEHGREVHVLSGRGEDRHDPILRGRAPSGGALAAPRPFLE